MYRGTTVFWPVIGWLFALIIFTPIAALLFQSISGDDSDIFTHLFNTTLSSYVTNSLLLVFGTVLLSMIIAIPAAWFIAVCDFPLRHYLQWMLVLPLAMPTYVVAYIYTDMLDYAGPIQIYLRDFFAWQSVDDYWFWDFRSISGAICVLALGLFPYLYLIVRNTFAKQEANLINAARALGSSVWTSFWRIALPLARPAIVIGSTLIAMETLGDFAVSNYFAVSTLTTAVYDTWLSLGSIRAAAKISVLMLFGVVALVLLEKFSRRQSNTKYTGKNTRLQRYSLRGYQAWLVTTYCCLLVVLGFVLPVAVLITYVINYFSASWTDQFLQISINSLKTSFFAAAIATIVAIVHCFNQRLNAKYKLATQLSSLGYAIPGTVMAIAVLIPLTALDHSVNGLLKHFQMPTIGLIFSGTIVALVFAFVVRFSALAIGSVDAGYQRMSNNLDHSARILGAKPIKLLSRVHIPLLKMPILTAFLLVFIESMKELPAALLLRPFNFDTLATYVYQFVSDEQLHIASMAALLLVIVGLIPLIFLSSDKPHREQHDARN